MSDPAEPKKKLDTARGGSGRNRKTAVGSGEDGDAYSLKPSEAGGPAVWERRKDVVLCDKSQLIRDGWTAMLATLGSEMKVVGEAVDSESAIYEITLKRPQLVILDLDMGELVSGYDVCGTCADEFRIIVASEAHLVTRYFHRLLRKGVQGIALKSSGWQTLFEAVRSGDRRNPYVDRKLEPLMRQRPALAPAEFGEAEHDIATRLAMSNKEIAEELGREEADVEMIMTMVMKKLGAVTPEAALVCAEEAGYIGLPLAVSTGKRELAEKLAREAIKNRKTS